MDHMFVCIIILCFMWFFRIMQGISLTDRQTDKQTEARDTGTGEIQLRKVIMEIQRNLQYD